MRRLIIFSLMSGFIVAGCATQRIYVGEELPEDQIAILVRGKGVDSYFGYEITKIDEQEIGEGFINEIHLLPGDHELYIDGGYYPIEGGYYHFKFTVKAGHTYTFNRKGISGAWVEDVTDGKVVGRIPEDQIAILTEGEGIYVLANHIDGIDGKGIADDISIGDEIYLHPGEHELYLGAGQYLKINVKAGHIYTFNRKDISDWKELVWVDDVTEGKMVGSTEIGEGEEVAAVQEKYQDPDLPSEQCATIVIYQGDSDFSVYSIDGKWAGGKVLGKDKEFIWKRRMTPGVHEIVVSYFRLTGRSKETAHRLVAIEAKAGHTYVPRCKIEGKKAHIWISEEGPSAP